MRYLSRRKIYERVPAHADAKKVYIFCEGEEKEVNYFKYFQGFSSNIDIIPIPNDQGQSDPVKLMENAELLFLINSKDSIAAKYVLSKEYKDEVWFVIDTDRWNEGQKIETLKAFCQHNNKSYDGWFVAQSNPSFELWLYYHFFDQKPEASEVDTHASFKAYVHHKIKGGFDHRSMPIEIAYAVDHSQKNFDIENNQPILYATELHFLGNVILQFIKEQLEKARSMISSGRSESRV